MTTTLESTTSISSISKGASQYKSRLSSIRPTPVSIMSERGSSRSLSRKQSRVPDDTWSDNVSLNEGCGGGERSTTPVSAQPPRSFVQPNLKAPPVTTAMASQQPPPVSLTPPRMEWSMSPADVLSSGDFAHSRARIQSQRAIHFFTGSCRLQKFAISETFEQSFS